MISICKNNSYLKTLLCQVLFMKEKSFEYILQPHATKLCKPVFALKEGCPTFASSSHSAGAHSTLRTLKLNLWTDENIPQSLWFRPKTPAFSCHPLSLLSSQIKFLMRLPSVRKHVNRTLCKLLPCRSSLREELSSMSNINQH